MGTEIITWQEVAARVVGWDIEAQEGDRIYRGPIGSVRIENSQVYFDNTWVAVSTGSTRGVKWYKWYVISCHVSVDIVPTVDNDGRIRFLIPGVGPVVIFPPNISQLDRQVVVELPEGDVLSLVYSDCDH